MRQVIPFTKDIEFKTMINEITNISLEHDLSLKDSYTINGNFIITGKYKINETSMQEDDFSYKIPIDISLDQSYKTDKIELEIEDFKYEKVDSNVLKVNIDLSLENLEKKEEKEEIEILECDERKMLSDEEKENIKELITGEKEINLFEETTDKKELNLKEESIKQSSSLFEAFKNSDETFSTYSVYIIRDGDNLDEVISKYKTTREILEEYNDMSNIKIGTKLIIPNTKDENDK